MNKAVFLDRDGIINKEIGDYIKNLSEFEFNPSVFSALKRLKDAGYLLIVITNQGGISKGIFTTKDLNDITSYMQQELIKHEIKIDEIYYCSHHPDVTKCLCRKPSPLMIEKAVARFKIDKTKSYMIGDAPRDVEAAENAGIKGILVPANSDLNEVVTLILENKI